MSSEEKEWVYGIKDVQYKTLDPDPNLPDIATVSVTIELEPWAIELIEVLERLGYIKKCLS